jgi:hypothetical protein
VSADLVSPPGPALVTPNRVTAAARTVLLYEKALVVAVTILYLVARLWSFYELPLDSDEIFSLQMVRHGWTELLEGVIADSVHPPLFYLALKVWGGVAGMSTSALRLFPILLSGLSLLVFWRICVRLELSRLSTVVAMLLMACNGYLIRFHEQIRMYSLLELLSLTSFLLLIRFVLGGRRQGTNLALLMLTNVALVHTQYYGWAVVLVECVIVCVALFRRPRRVALFAACTVIVGLMFVPWAWTTYQAIKSKGGLESNVGWISRPTWTHVKAYIAELTGDIGIPYTAKVGVALFAAPVIAWGLLLFRRGATAPAKEKLVFFSLVTACALPVIMAFLLSKTASSSFWGTRHLIICAAPFLILVSLAASKLPSRGWRRASLAAVTLWAATAGAVEIPREKTKIEWDRLVTSVAGTRPTGPLKIMCLENFTAVPLAFYASEFGHTRIEVRRLVRPFTVHEDRFWLAVRNSVPEQNRRAQELLERGGYRLSAPMVSEKKFTSIAVYPVTKR